MIITFENGQKVITHPSEKIVRQDASDVQKLLDVTQSRITELKADEAGYQKDLLDITASLSP